MQNTNHEKHKPGDTIFIASQQKTFQLTFRKVVILSRRI